MKIKKIYIMGTSGSGKSHLAKTLSKILKIKHFDLDDIYWVNKYTKSLPKEKRKPKLRKLLLKNKSWIIEGVYTIWALDAIKKSDLVILLDTNILTRSYRVLKRFIKRYGKYDESFLDAINILKYTWKYKRKSNLGHTSYKTHITTLKDNKINYIILKDKSEIKIFLKHLEGLK